MSDRRKAREVAVQTLYEIAHTEAPYAGALAANLARRSGNAAVHDYADRLVRTVVERRAEIAAELAAALDNWALDRVAMVDRCVLEIACAELLWFEDVPVAVAIHEAVDIVRKFSTAESGAFVNGVLDRIARAPRPPRAAAPPGAPAPPAAEG